jgi:FixJ family two-component response regulator
MQTIYLLDYDTDISYALCKWFTFRGIEAKSFSTLEQLLLQLNISHPDCIILDCLFGRVSLTSDICYAIRHVSHYSGNILLTSTSTILSKDVQACNAVGFIAKPFNFDSMLSLINELSGDVYANA